MMIDGAMIQELFRGRGIGAMITELSLEAMRQTNIEDVGGIFRLIILWIIKTYRYDVVAVKIYLILPAASQVGFKQRF